MSDVIWMPHPVYTSYEASSDGRVRSIDRVIVDALGRRRRLRGHELYIHRGPNGRLGCTIGLGTANARKRVECHVMVCEAFHGLKTSPKLEVRHLNGQKDDNSASNLCWSTHKENERDKLTGGVVPQNTISDLEVGRTSHASPDREAAILALLEQQEDAA